MPLPERQQHQPGVNLDDEVRLAHYAKWRSVSPCLLWSYHPHFVGTRHHRASNFGL
jgi:hypothetical protein